MSNLFLLFLIIISLILKLDGNINKILSTVEEKFNLIHIIRHIMKITEF